MINELPIGQGHGVEGIYAGLPDQYSTEASSKVILLPIPFEKTTTYQKGCAQGPEAIIEASRNLELYDIETDSEVYLKGICTAAAIQADTSEEMIHLGYSRTKEYLSQGKFSIAIGGEHTISYGPIRAYAESYQETTILQLDAHADLQMAYENNPWSHASVMMRVKELPQVKKIVSVGIRSLSKEELPHVDRPHTFFAHELDSNGLWVEKVLEKLSGNIYITVDLDVFDCSLMPSTGTPEPGGLSWNQALNLLKRVFNKHHVVGFDIVELAPSLYNRAPDYLAAKLIYKLLSYKYLNT